MKCTDEKWKLKKILSCRFEGKKTKDQATNLPWMNESLFSSRLESAEGKLCERRFKVHFVCFFYRRESLFGKENYQLALCY